MAGRKESAKITDVQKAVAGWPELYVVGNKPYAKGCYLFRRGTGETAPRLLHACDTNWEMLELVTRSEFSPLMFDKKDSSSKSFFPQYESTGGVSAKYVLKKALDYLTEGEELIEGLMGIEPLQPGVLRKIYSLWRGMK